MCPTRSLTPTSRLCSRFVPEGFILPPLCPASSRQWKHRHRLDPMLAYLCPLLRFRLAHCKKTTSHRSPPFFFTRCRSGSTDCTVCPGGSACPNPADLPTACTDGYFSPEGADTCTICPAGSYCPGPPRDEQSKAVCPPGSYSESGSSACSTCPLGSSCSNPAQAPVPCSSGFYADVVNMTECTRYVRICFGFDTSLAVVTGVSFNLWLQLFVRFRDPFIPKPLREECRITLRRSIPPLSPVQPLHPRVSTLSASHRLQHDKRLFRCTAGNSCPNAALPAEPCPAGYYSEDLAVSCTPCSPGFACPTAAAGQVACSPGTFAVGLASNCTSCQPGYSCPNTAAAEFEECPDGTYSTGDATSCTVCPAGSYCPLKTVDAALPCPNGYYSTGAARNCTACEPGFSCTSIGSKSPCDAGFYSVEGAMDCTSCPAGYECPYTDAVRLARDKKLTCDV